MAFEAHAKDVPALSFSPGVPGMLATASLDKHVRVWDLSTTVDGRPACTAEKALKVGKLFCLGFLKDLPFTLAAAGAKGSIAVWDTTEDSNVWATFASRVSPEVAAPVESKQALTGIGAMKL